MFFVMILACVSVAQIDIGGALGETKGQPDPEPVTVHARHTASAGSEAVEVELRLDMPSDVYIYAAESLFFAIEHGETEGVGSPDIELPRAHEHRNFDGTSVKVFTDEQVIRISYPVEGKPWRVAGSLRYQACNTRMCFMPTTMDFSFTSGQGSGPAAGNVESGIEGHSDETREMAWHGMVEEFEVVGRTQGYVPAEEFASFLRDPAGTTAAGGVFAGKNIWIVVLLALLGGLALNLTPCVLPMLPITLAVIGAGAQARSRAHGFGVGAVYGTGMAVAYGAAGAVVVLTGTTFGALNSSAGFNLGIAVLFVVLAVAMFDLIHIDFSRYRSRVKPETVKRGKLLGVFAMGIVTALLAGACVAPVLISVILYATSMYAEGQVTGAFLPFALGIGMALPWPFAGAGLTLLPKPGKWMVWVRNGFGVVILLIALYYGYTGVQLLRSPSPPADTGMVEDTGEWNESLVEGLRESLASGKPVLIDFWATWCKNCHAMDATTLKDKRVQQRLDDYVLVKYQAEHPREEPARSILEHFGVLGLPTYVVVESVPADGVLRTGAGDETPTIVR